MIHFLDVLLPPDMRHSESHIKGEPQAKDADDESVWTTEVDDAAESAPIIDSNLSSSVDGTAVAALAVVLLLGASLVAMAKLSKMSVRS